MCRRSCAMTAEPRQRRPTTMSTTSVPSAAPTTPACCNFPHTPPSSCHFSYRLRPAGRMTRAAPYAIGYLLIHSLRPAVSSPAPFFHVLRYSSFLYIMWPGTWSAPCPFCAFICQLLGMHRRVSLSMSFVYRPLHLRGSAKGLISGSQ